MIPKYMLMSHQMEELKMGLLGKNEPNTAEKGEMSVVNTACMRIVIL